MIRRQKWLLISYFSLFLIVPILYDRGMSVRGIGFTDLTMQFVVTDNDTGKPIPQAVISFKSPYPVPIDTEHDSSPIVTDEAGVAVREFPNSSIYTTSSGFGLTKSFVVRPPSWLFQVTAKDYQPGEWLPLDHRPFMPNQERIGPGQTKMTIPVSLKKSSTPLSPLPDPQP